MTQMNMTNIVGISPSGDYVGLPGCNIIYTPHGRAAEYAPLAANMYAGCTHACVYCWVPQALHKTRAQFISGAFPRPKEAAKYHAAGISEQVLLSFTCDPYPPEDNSLTRHTIEVLHDHGLAHCTLTKGGTRALRDMDLFRPDRDAFATTLTALDPNVQRKWEPGAASPDDRVAALKAFHDHGIFTWVSLEPTLDLETSLQIIGMTHEFVDLFKIGKMNYCQSQVDWREYTERAIELCDRLTVGHYIKQDLAMYLPAGYTNPVRILQHN